MPMQISPRPNRLAIAMVTAGLLAGAMAALSTWLDASPSARRPLPPLPAVAQDHVAPAAQPMAPDGEALRRPLFSPARRPQPKPASPAGAAAVDPAPDLTVTGIIAGSDGGAVAGLDKRTQKPFSLRAGESLGDWRVDSIDRGTLRLRRGDQTRDYPLQLPPSPPKATRQP